MIHSPENTFLPGRDEISKLAFTAIGSPDSKDPGAGPAAPHNLGLYITNGPPATRKEVLSYYAYFAGNNGIGAFQ